MKNARPVLSLALAVLLTFGLPVTALADGEAPDRDQLLATAENLKPGELEEFLFSLPTEEPVDCQVLFALFGRCDGAYSEYFSILLANAFDRDRADFLAQLSRRSEEEIKEAAHLIVYQKGYGDLDGFGAEIADLRDAGTWSQAELAILSRMEGEIRRVMASEMPARTYTVKKGDTLSGIAYEHYGDWAMYRAIFRRNRDIIRDPNLIFIGQVLVLPAP